MSWRIGIDTGGTFTDVVAFDTETGALHATKTPSVPADPSQAFAEGLRLILEQAGASPDQVSTVSHGTTVATNALLEDETDGLALLTTTGFRNVLEIARQSVPDGYGNSYFWVKPDRIVPLHLVREVPERLDATGEVVRPLDEDAVRREVEQLRDAGVHSIGVCLLHSYLNPEHEERVAELVAEVHPTAAVSISSRVLREYREYERSVTTLVDAFVKDKVVHYITSIQDRLAELAAAGDGGASPGFYVMKSNGGVISADAVGDQPITTVLSGPAAGALGAAELTGRAGFDRVLALDGGGTSTDVTVVEGAIPALTTEGSVGRHPTKVPMIDIVTVGTGGGSIAWISPEGGLKVGPRSAGADPGPLCYGLGGTEPTVTDAHLVLGRIPPALIGGGVPLDVDAARRGLEGLAADLGLEVEEAAAGVLEIAAWNQANAIRQVTVRRGLDVRDFALCGFGGSGPLQACRLVDILSLEAAVIPRDPGNVSAYGLLVVDLRHDEVQTLVGRHTELSVDRLAKAYGGLEERATKALVDQGYPASEQRIERWADLRYEGQAFEVQAAAPAGPVDGPEFVEGVLAAFHDEHERQYGYCYRDREVVEWVNLRVSAFGPITSPSPQPVGPGSGADPARTRPVFADGEWMEAPIHDRAMLGAGDAVAGPAVIEEFGSTTPILPGFSARVDDLGNLVIRKA